MPFRSPSQRAVTPQHRGRFPGFDVLDQVEVWDDVTAGVVLARLALPNELTFFSPREVGIAQPLLDLLLEQDGEPHIPVLALIDTRLATGETDGWHYDDMPEDADAWRHTLAGLDDAARERFGEGFAGLTDRQQGELITDVHEAGEAGEQWHGYPAKRVWSLWTRYACTAFYSHPWAWNEIGFSGPAYPRGYLNIGIEAREKWEVADPHDGDPGADPVPFAARVQRAREAHDAHYGSRSKDDA